MPSVKFFASAANANTIRAISSAVLPFLSSFVLLAYSVPLLVASTGSAEPLRLIPLLTTRTCDDEDEGDVSARSPVLRMIEPSDLERMRVD